MRQRRSTAVSQGGNGPDETKPSSPAYLAERTPEVALGGLCSCVLGTLLAMGIATLIFAILNYESVRGMRRAFEAGAGEGEGEAEGVSRSVAETAADMAVAVFKRRRQLAAQAP